jgi:hypothetical protein
MARGSADRVADTCRAWMYRRRQKASVLIMPRSYRSPGREEGGSQTGWRPQQFLMIRMYQVAASALRHVDSNNAGRSGDADVGQERIACRAGQRGGPGRSRRTRDRSNARHAYGGQIHSESPSPPAPILAAIHPGPAGNDTHRSTVSRNTLLERAAMGGEGGAIGHLVRSAA